jgi:hypothetical protein
MVIGAYSACRHSPWRRRVSVVGLLPAVPPADREEVQRNYSDRPSRQRPEQPVDENGKRHEALTRRAIREHGGSRASDAGKQHRTRDRAHHDAAREDRAPTHRTGGRVAKDWLGLLGRRVERLLHSIDHIVEGQGSAEES